MVYIPIQEKYKNEIFNLVEKNYINEKENIPYLPNFKNIEELLNKEIDDLIDNGEGYIALIEDNVVGFIAGYEVDNFFGKNNGIYIPLFGHGALFGAQQDIYQRLYAYSSKKWLEKGYTSHAITIFAHNNEAVVSWFWLGFGMRCVDAIRQSKLIEKLNSEVVINKITEDDITDELIKILIEHDKYYRESPIFMIKDRLSKKETNNELINFLSNKTNVMWVARENDELCGYIQIENYAENFVSDSKDVMNITGLYVKPKYRNKNVGISLLNYVQEYLCNNRIKLCGVDFESINIKGSNFWTKYFTPYTYSLTRRIDERLIDEL